MLKQLLLILTLSAILLQTFSKSVILLGFQVNRDFISKNLCIKKAEANNCCKGSCHLKKQLSEDERKESTAPVKTSKDQHEVQLFCEQQAVPVALPLSNDAGIAHYLLQQLPAAPSFIFHPPCA